ncbi:phosphopantetheine-binding protein [Nocardia sp. NPDC057227]|uniref:phosphopantetheine-binding protein n=1 Tax=Nocardia sp. NPDC057227 TaxID=3346056 RepID=UPI00362F3BEF
MPQRISVKEFIVTNFAPDVTAHELADDYELVDSGLVNSLALLRLISWVGERYGINIDDIDIDRDDFRSVAAIEKFIEVHAPLPGR